MVPGVNRLESPVKEAIHRENSFLYRVYEEMEEYTSANTPKMDWNSRDLPTAWRSFRRHLEFMFGGPLKSKSEEQKCNYLMIWVGEKGRDIYQTWTFEEGEEKKLNSYYERFEAHVKPKSNKVFARYRFHKKVQCDNESFEQFLIDLKLLVKDCGYADPDEMVRDRIVIGCNSKKVREKLIQEGSELSLEKAVEIALTLEMSQTQLKTMEEEDSKIHAVKVNQARRQSEKLDKRKHGRPGVEQECGMCGYIHSSKAECPAKGKKCLICAKLNHFAKVCKSREKRRTVQYVAKCESGDDARTNETSSESEDEMFYVGCIDAVNAVSLSEWREELTINNKKVIVQLDTGAKCNVMSLTTLKTLGGETTIQPTAAKLRSYSGHQIPIHGCTTLLCEHKDKTYPMKFYIAEGDVLSVLSAQACKDLNLVQRVNSVIDSSVITDARPDILLEYPDLFQGLGCLPGKHTIRIDPTVVPVVHPPRKVPVALKGRIKDELERMVKAGVVARQIEPTAWVSSMVTVVKPNKIRICLDPRDLNLAVKREHFPMKTIEEIVADVPDAKVFSVLDATSGFWQIELDEESSKLCTFNTPFGRYRFKRLPFGIKSAPEVFQRYMTEMLEGIPGAEPIAGAIVDDILIWGSSIDQHDARLRQVLNRAREFGLKLNSKKCQVRKDQVPYVGHLLTSDGLKPDPEKVRAVEAMQPPRNVKELRTFLGFIQYLGKFLPNLAAESAPLRQLLEKEVVWHWNKEQQQSFKTLKHMVTKSPVLGYYNPNKPVTLTVDASANGLGAVLLQENKPIAYASRALTVAQQKYAQIEKELLAIVYACQKFHQYVYGRTVHMESDHKPLERILAQNLHQAPPRLQKMMMSLQRYDLKVIYKPGNEMQLADTLSRHYLPETKETLVEDLEVSDVCLTAYLPISQEKYLELQQATAADPVLQSLTDTVLEGWPDGKAKLSPDLRQYWAYKDEISVIDALLFKGPKVIVPHTLQSEMLDKIHEGHLGVVKCKQRARDVLFWPGMSTQIEDKVAKCYTCSQHQRQQAKEPMIPHDPPNRPWAKIGTDLFEMNSHHYLCTVDCYSKWVEVDQLENQSSKATVNALKKHFSRYGIPDEVVSDNGPQFGAAEFAEFAKDYEFAHTTTSPHYPQSNGQIERAVQTTKNLMSKSVDINKALLSYRTTPLDTIYQSPGQLMMGRRLKTTLPTTAELLRPQGQEEVVGKLKKVKETQKHYFDRHCGRELESLQTGDIVKMKHRGEWVPAVVSYKHHTPRSFVVETASGRKYRRNRRHLNRSRAPGEQKFEARPEQTEITLPPTNVQRETTVQKETAEPVNMQRETAKPVASAGEPVTVTRSGRLVKTPSYLKDCYT